jgi:hypothetical protein
MKEPLQCSRTLLRSGHGAALWAVFYTEPQQRWMAVRDRARQAGLPGQDRLRPNPGMSGSGTTEK